ncbi:sulfatase family protein [Aegicerativicinus sediminis]|uniref:sulfatase family protein n=1 Tax=Aegicerativicinus sediminis TaxID=2893202 RepID=UPI001E4F2803|nr:arylsulfatase [Aegicerativicinus sediminis]
MKHRFKGLTLSFLLLFFTACEETKKESQGLRLREKPNIVIIYLDDLGYGDVGAYGATAIKTPNMDRLANGGVKFLDGHASSATCTPSRFALLTGLYPWRNKDAHVLPGNAPLIIDTAKITVPKVLKASGYNTGIVGKWHLGLGNGDVNWNERISPGPNELGFDYSYILAATQDRVPTVYIENGNVDNLDRSDPIDVSYSENFEGQPTGKDNPELLTMMWDVGHNNSIVNGIGRIGYMRGGESAKWSDIDMADHFLNKAQSFVKENKESPFFLYYAMQQPHVPRTPHPRFKGATDLGPRGDVIVEADWCIGQFIRTLEEESLLENTLIILSSDNGPVLNDGYRDEADVRNGNHTPWGPFRGGKYCLFEAGTRVPFVTYWKGKITPKTSNALVSQIDLLTSFAKLVGSEESTQDSENILDALLGESDIGRKKLVLEASGRTALRKGKWAMIPPHKGPSLYSGVNIESGNDEAYQLYDLEIEKAQLTNLADSLPEKLEELKQDFQEIIDSEEK